MASHSSILARRIPMEKGAWWGTVPMGFKESDTTEQVTLSLYDYTVEVTNRFKG